MAFPPAAARRELHHPLRRLELGARLIRKHLGTSRRVALLFGSEKVGLSNEDFSHCHWLLHIPTCEQNVSMNLGQAVAVCLYELARDAKAAAPSDAEAPATAGDVEQVHRFIRDALTSRFKSEGTAIRILYGGSVKPSNAAELMGVANVNGALVGGASLKAADFLAIAAGCP